MKPWNYYALEATEAQVLALAEVSPPAAWMVAISRVGGPGLPAPLEVNDSVYTSIVNAAMVKVFLAGHATESEYREGSPPLEGGVGYLARSHVDRLRNGHRLVVVETELLHHPSQSTVGIPYPPFGVEIERVVGHTLANPDQLDNPARVWRVVSWGEPGAYYR